MFTLVGSKLASSAVASTTRTSLRLSNSSFRPSLRIPSLSIATRGLRSLADLETMTSSSTTPASAGASHQSIAPTIRPKQTASALPPPSIILTLSGPDGPGIVHRISGFLARRNMNIMDSAQFGDPTTGTFFMRVHASEPLPSNGAAHPDPSASDYAQQRTSFLAKVKSEFDDEFAKEADVSVKIFGAEEKPRTLIMVSKIGHCLNDLLFRLSNNTLPITVPLIISNHADYEPLAKANGIPFYHLPINAAEGKTKQWQEAEMVKLAKEYDIDMIVLARYMQILSPQLCSLFSGRIINIHHSFLPSFKGAKPYHQAFERGVKLIGATAHFVTADLDEGPIIEQAVERVDHAMTPADLVQAGSDVEARVLARAVKWTAERRVLLNGAKTVVFN